MVAAAVIFSGLLILDNFSVQLPGFGSAGQAVELKKMLDSNYVLDGSIDYFSFTLTDIAGIIPGIFTCTSEESDIHPIGYFLELFTTPMLVDLPPPDLA